MNVFAALGVAEDLTALLKLQGIKMPTPIQQASIPSIFKGKDLIGRSQTGTGKTLAYLLPVIQRVDKDRGATQVLIMTPTRELSKQVFDVFRPFALKLGLDGVDIIGGRTIDNQLQKLKRDPQVIIGTPGRLLDHIRRKSLDLSQVKTVILDRRIRCWPMVSGKISKLWWMKRRKSGSFSSFLPPCPKKRCGWQGNI